MAKPTCVTLFSGGGLKAIGALNAGFDLVGAVEYDESIAAVLTYIRQSWGHNAAPVSPESVSKVRALVIYLLKDCCAGKPELCAPLLEDLTPCCSAGVTACA